MFYFRTNSRIIGCIAIGIFCVLFIVSCTEDENGGGVPSELVSGTVRDVSGIPIEGVNIHVIYEIEAIDYGGFSEGIVTNLGDQQAAVHQATASVFGNASIQSNYHGSFLYTGNNPLTSGGDCLGFDTPNDVTFSYYTGTPLTSGGECFAGTGIPDGAAQVEIWLVGGGMLGSYPINGAAVAGAAGLFYGLDYYLGAGASDYVYCVVSHDNCTYTTVDTYGPVGEDGASVNYPIDSENDWDCQCEVEEECVWIEYQHAVCLNFTDAGEENGIDLCWCCPFGTEPSMTVNFEWTYGCTGSNPECDDPSCIPYTGPVHGLDYAWQHVVENDTTCMDYSGVGYWTTRVWADGEGCICLHFNNQLIVELTAEPILQIGDRQLTLSFNVADEMNVQHYDIMRDGAKVAELEVADGSYTYVDQNLINGRRYEYSIVAVGLDETIVLEFDGNSVWAATPSFLATVVTEYAFHKNFPNPVEDTTRIVYDILEAIHVQLTFGPAGGGTIATLVSAVLGTGRYRRTLDMSNLANGLYVCEMDTGDALFASCTMLKNTQSYASLRNALSNSTTLDNGSYAFNVAIGDSIDIRDELYHELGRVLLERVTFVALKNGYLPADTTLDLTEQDHYTIDFTLYPELNE